MSIPVKIEKDFNEWTFDELCKWAAWEVAQALLAGRPLKSVMYSVLDAALQWKQKEEIK